MIELLSIRGRSNWQVKNRISLLNIKPDLKTLLNVLLEFRNPNNIYSIFPSIRLIAERYGKGIKQTRRDLNVLEQEKLIRAIDCYSRADGRQGSNVYILLQTILTPADRELRKDVEALKPRHSKFRHEGKLAAELNDECASPIYYSNNGGKGRNVKVQCFQGGDGQLRESPPPKIGSHNLDNINHESKKNNPTTTTNSVVAGVGVEQDIAKCLKNYAELFPEQQITAKTKDKFAELYTHHNLGKDKVMEGFKTLAADELLRQNTISPNRVFNLTALLKSKTMIVARVKKITSECGHNHDLWLRHILGDRTLGRWHSDDLVAITRTAYRVAFGKSAEECRHLWDPDFRKVDRTPAEPKPEQSKLTITRSDEFTPNIIRGDEPDDILCERSTSAENESIKTQNLDRTPVKAPAKFSLKDFKRTVEVERLCHVVMNHDIIKSLKSSNPELCGDTINLFQSIIDKPEGVDLAVLRRYARDPSALVDPDSDEAQWPLVEGL